MSEGTFGVNWFQDYWQYKESLAAGKVQFPIVIYGFQYASAEDVENKIEENHSEFDPAGGCGLSSHK